MKAFKINKKLGESIKRDLDEHFIKEFPDMYSGFYYEPVDSEYGIKIRLDEKLRINITLFLNRQEIECLFNGEEVFGLYETTIYDFEDLDDFSVFLYTPDFSELVEYSITWDSNEETFTRKQIENFKDHESISSKIIDSIILD